VTDILQQPAVLKGFEHISRYYDKARNMYLAKILPGEYYVTTHNELVATVLGSCVSACIRDKVKCIGGMNHFMLPVNTHELSSTGTGFTLLSEATRYGNFAMEHMINDILKNGARKENLEIKIVGGGRIIANMTNIGQKNIDFVREYIHKEGLNLIGEDVGDIYPRKVIYHPKSGRVIVKRLKHLHNITILNREKNYMHNIEKPITGEIELF